MDMHKAEDNLDFSYVTFGLLACVCSISISGIPVEPITSSSLWPYTLQLDLRSEPSVYNSVRIIRGNSNLFVELFYSRGRYFPVLADLSGVPSSLIRSYYLFDNGYRHMLPQRICVM